LDGSSEKHDFTSSQSGSGHSSGSLSICRFRRTQLPLRPPVETAIHYGVGRSVPPPLLHARAHNNSSDSVKGTITVCIPSTCLTSTALLPRLVSSCSNFHSVLAEYAALASPATNEMGGTHKYHHAGTHQHQRALLPPLPAPSWLNPPALLCNKITYEHTPRVTNALNTPSATTTVSCW
jgi:hypothetical protein